MREQRGLTSTRRLIHHHKLTIIPLQTPQHLIRCTLLPRSRLPPKIPKPKKHKIIQRTPRLLTQRRIHQHPTNLNHPQFSSSHQPRRPLIPPLKPISRRNPQPRPPSSSLNPQTRITGIKILTPPLQLHLLHNSRLPKPSTPALEEITRAHIYPVSGWVLGHTPRQPPHNPTQHTQHTTTARTRWALVWFCWVWLGGGLPWYVVVSLYRAVPSCVAVRLGR
jgi:hypothetical protein